MPTSATAAFDQTVLDMIEHSPTGSVPRTPSYDEALTRLDATRQVYASADHKGGYVTARSLSRLPSFMAFNLQEIAASEHAVLESNNSIFDRYLQSLNPMLRPVAEGFRLLVAGKPIHHRPKVGGPLARDPVHSIFLVPGAGPRPGLPGNYLHGVLAEKQEGQKLSWSIRILDSDNDAAACEVASAGEAVERMQELVESAPFHLSELEALGFTLV